MSKAGQIGLKMWAAALDTITVTFPKLLYSSFFRIVALGILQAFWGEALEEIVDIFVICPLALCFESAREENLVNPVLLVMNNAIFEKGAVNVKAIIPIMAIPCIDTPGMEVKHDLLYITVDHDSSIDTHASEVSLF